MKTTNTNKDIFIPTLILKNTVLMPSIALPVLVTKQQAINAINVANSRDKLIYVTTLREGKDLEEARPADFFPIGTLATIEKQTRNEKNETIVYIKSIDRYYFSSVLYDPELLAWVSKGEILPDLYDLDASTETALLKNLYDVSLDILNIIRASDEFKASLKQFKTVAEFTNVVCQNLPIIISKKQEILEIQSIKNRALKVLELLVEQRELFKVNSEMGAMISEKTSRAYRESILREQLRAIKEELGESNDSVNSETGEKISLKERILKARLPLDVEKIALEQLNRHEAMGPQNAESHVIKNYLELILALPWNVEDISDIDLEKARAVLDDEHFGLKKVKEHILSHLAVMKLSPNKKGSILLLVGPPGVGKTSVAQSIANALERKFVRASLGGVRDDSEIRGHRRTYIGSMPGRIIEGIKRAKTKNPIFLLDEIDKLNRGYGGDPASALLEVLDPEQNQTFLDHYLDVAFDLSKVFFIATANSLETIPAPLLDRMEIINLSGYTNDEKFYIAKNHLLPKQLIENGIPANKLIFSDTLLQQMINEYTREAGVRELQRKIAKVLRTLSLNIVKIIDDEKAQPYIVTNKNLEDIFGPHKVRWEEALNHATPGVVTGLAWTPVGGDILFIETLMMPGNGKIQLTGKLGEVMSESAHIGLSLMRSRLSGLIPGFDFAKTDFHIHVPSGAIPKDGPSAGITIFTALASLVLGKGVDPKMAMTGELTLRGAVMPVGGIKEKLIAAHRAGIKKVIMSKQNEKDLIEVPDIVKKELEILFVENINELLQIVFNHLNINYKNDLMISPPFEKNYETNFDNENGVAHS